MENFLKGWIGIRSHTIQKRGHGSYILKLKPNTQTPYHKRTNYEEFHILDGQLIDKDHTNLIKETF